MEFKNLMIESLTKLLRSGETLYHPFFGAVEKGGYYDHAFFGFTEKHLLIAFVTGNNIHKTERIPLNIQSVTVKKSLVGQHIIDISFSDNAPIKIRAYQNFRRLDCQKDNLPKFLECLSEKAPQKEPLELKNIEGEKIRWQYFNVCLYVILSFLPMIVIVLAALSIKDGSFSFLKLINSLMTSVFCEIVILSPLILLSLLNRFLFGRTVCVINDSGIHLDNNFLPWNKIKKVSYIPDFSSKWHLRYCRAYFTVKSSAGKEYDVEANHFPLYGLRKIKKINPDIEIKIAKGNILFFAIAPTVMGIVFSVFVFFE